MKEQQNIDGEYMGYARVSTDDQNPDMQVRALEEFGVPPANIFTDTASGSTMDRPSLKLAVKLAARGDVLVVWKLDRLGRSVRGVLDAVEHLEEKGIGLRSLTEPIDTTTPMGKMVMTVLLALAEMERDMISERTKEGLKAYIARGGRMGPKHSILDNPKRAKRFRELWDAGHVPDGGMSGADIIREMNAADPSAKPISGPQMYANWKSAGFKGFEITPDDPLPE